MSKSLMSKVRLFLVAVMVMAFVAGAGIFGFSAKAEEAFTLDQITYEMDGASIRIGESDGLNGLRFTAKLTKEDYALINANVGDGKTYSNIEYGILIAPADYASIVPLTQATVFGVGGDKIYDWAVLEDNAWVYHGDNKLPQLGGTGVRIINIYSNEWIEDADAKGEEAYIYSGAIVNILDGAHGGNNNLAREMYSTAYIKATKADGTIEYKFAPNYKSMSATYVAQKTIEMGVLSPEHTAWLQANYIDKAVGSKTCSYTTEHYIVTPDGAEHLVDSVVTKGANIDQEVTAEAKSFAGFTFNEAYEGSLLTGKVYANDSLTLKVYYTLNEIVDETVHMVEVSDNDNVVISSMFDAETKNAIDVLSEYGDVTYVFTDNNGKETSVDSTSILTTPAKQRQYTVKIKYAGSLVYTRYVDIYNLSNFVWNEFHADSGIENALKVYYPSAPNTIGVGSKVVEQTTFTGSDGVAYDTVVISDARDWNGNNISEKFFTILPLHSKAFYEQYQSRGLSFSFDFYMSHSPEYTGEYVINQWYIRGTNSNATTGPKVGSANLNVWKTSKITIDSLIENWDDILYPTTGGYSWSTRAHNLMYTLNNGTNWSDLGIKLYFKGFNLVGDPTSTVLTGDQQLIDLSNKEINAKQFNLIETISPENQNEITLAGALVDSMTYKFAPAFGGTPIEITDLTNVDLTALNKANYKFSIEATYGSTTWDLYTSYVDIYDEKDGYVWINVDQSMLDYVFTHTQGSWAAEGVAPTVVSDITTVENGWFVSSFPSRGGSVDNVMTVMPMHSKEYYQEAANLGASLKFYYWPSSESTTEHRVFGQSAYRPNSSISGGATEANKVTITIALADLIAQWDEYTSGNPNTKDGRGYDYLIRDHGSVWSGEKAAAQYYLGGFNVVILSAGTVTDTSVEEVNVKRVSSINALDYITEEDLREINKYEKFGITYKVTTPSGAVVTDMDIPTVTADSIGTYTINAYTCDLLIYTGSFTTVLTPDTDGLKLVDVKNIGDTYDLATALTQEGLATVQSYDGIVPTYKLTDTLGNVITVEGGILALSNSVLRYYENLEVYVNDILIYSGSIDLYDSSKSPVWVEANEDSLGFYKGQSKLDCDSGNATIHDEAMGTIVDVDGQPYVKTVYSYNGGSDGSIITALPIHSLNYYKLYEGEGIKFSFSVYMGLTEFPEGVTYVSSDYHYFGQGGAWRPGNRDGVKVDQTTLISPKQSINLKLDDFIANWEEYTSGKPDTNPHTSGSYAYDYLFAICRVAGWSGKFPNVIYTSGITLSLDSSKVEAKTDATVYEQDVTKVTSINALDFIKDADCIAHIAKYAPFGVTYKVTTPSGAVVTDMNIATVTADSIGTYTINAYAGGVLLYTGYFKTTFKPATDNVLRLIDVNGLSTFNLNSVLSQDGIDMLEAYEGYTFNYKLTDTRGKEYVKESNTLEISESILRHYDKVELYVNDLLLYTGTADMYNSADGIVWTNITEENLDYYVSAKKSSCNSNTATVTYDIGTNSIESVDGTNYVKVATGQTGAVGIYVTVLPLHSKEYYQQYEGLGFKLNFSYRIGIENWPNGWETDKTAEGYKSGGARSDTHYFGQYGNYRFGDSYALPVDYSETGVHISAKSVSPSISLDSFITYWDDYTSGVTAIKAHGTTAETAKHDYLVARCHLGGWNKVYASDIYVTGFTFTSTPVAVEDTVVGDVNVTGSTEYDLAEDFSEDAKKAINAYKGYGISYKLNGVAVDSLVIDITNPALMGEQVLTVYCGSTLIYTVTYNFINDYVTYVDGTKYSVDFKTEDSFDVESMFTAVQDKFDRISANDTIIYSIVDALGNEVALESLVLDKVTYATYSKLGTYTIKATASGNLIYQGEVTISNSAYALCEDAGEYSVDFANASSYDLTVMLANAQDTFDAISIYDTITYSIVDALGNEVALDSLVLDEVAYAKYSKLGTYTIKATASDFVLYSGNVTVSNSAYAIYEDTGVYGVDFADASSYDLANMLANVQDKLNAIASYDTLEYVIVNALGEESVLSDLVLSESEYAAKSKLGIFTVKVVASGIVLYQGSITTTNTLYDTLANNTNIYLTDTSKLTDSSRYLMTTNLSKDTLARIKKIASYDDTVKAVLTDNGSASVEIAITLDNVDSLYIDLNSADDYRYYKLTITASESDLAICHFDLYNPADGPVFNVISEDTAGFVATYLRDKCYDDPASIKEDGVVDFVEIDGVTYARATYTKQGGSRGCVLNVYPLHSKGYYEKLDGYGYKLTFNAYTGYNVQNDDGTYVTASGDFHYFGQGGDGRPSGTGGAASTNASTGRSAKKTITLNLDDFITYWDEYMAKKPDDEVHASGAYSYDSLLVNCSVDSYTRYANELYIGNMSITTPTFEVIEDTTLNLIDVTGKDEFDVTTIINSDGKQLIRNNMIVPTYKVVDGSGKETDLRAEGVIDVTDELNLRAYTLNVYFGSQVVYIGSFDIYNTTNGYVWNVVDQSTIGYVKVFKIQSCTTTGTANLATYTDIVTIDNIGGVDYFKVDLPTKVSGQSYYINVLPLHSEEYYVAFSDGLKLNSSAYIGYNDDVPLAEGVTEYATAKVDYHYFGCAVNSSAYRPVGDITIQASTGRTNRISLNFAMSDFVANWDAYMALKQSQTVHHSSVKAYDHFFAICGIAWGEYMYPFNVYLGGFDMQSALPTAYADSTVSVNVEGTSSFDIKSMITDEAVLSALSSANTKTVKYVLTDVNGVILDNGNSSTISIKDSVLRRWDVKVLIGADVVFTGSVDLYDLSKPVVWNDNVNERSVLKYDSASTLSTTEVGVVKTVIRDGVEVKVVTYGKSATSGSIFTVKPIHDKAYYEKFRGMGLTLNYSLYADASGATNPASKIFNQGFVYGDRVQMVDKIGEGWIDNSISIDTILDDWDNIMNASTFAGNGATSKANGMAYVFNLINGGRIGVAGFTLTVNATEVFMGDEALVNVDGISSVNIYNLMGAKHRSLVEVASASGNVTATLTAKVGGDVQEVQNLADFKVSLVQKRAYDLSVKLNGTEIYTQVIDFYSASENAVWNDVLSEATALVAHTGKSGTGWTGATTTLTAGEGYELIDASTVVDELDPLYGKTGMYIKVTSTGADQFTYSVRPIHTKSYYSALLGCKDYILTTEFFVTGTYESSSGAAMSAIGAFYNKDMRYHSYTTWRATAPTKDKWVTYSIPFDSYINATSAEGTISKAFLDFDNLGADGSMNNTMYQFEAYGEGYVLYMGLPYVDTMPDVVHYSTAEQQIDVKGSTIYDLTGLLSETELTKYNYLCSKYGYDKVYFKLTYADETSTILWIDSDHSAELDLTSTVEKNEIGVTTSTVLDKIALGAFTIEARLCDIYNIPGHTNVGVTGSANGCNNNQLIVRAESVTLTGLPEEVGVSELSFADGNTKFMQTANFSVDNNTEGGATKLYVDNADLEKTATLSVFQNEVEGMQLQVVPAKNVSVYHLRTADLTSGDNVLSATNFTVYHQLYTNVARIASSSNPTDIGMYPDALLPHAVAVKNGVATMSAGVNQGIWISLDVPAGQPAGVYTGSFRLLLGSSVYIIPVSITVYDYEVSDETYMTTSFGLGYTNILNLETEGEYDSEGNLILNTSGNKTGTLSQELIDAYNDFFADHRIGTSPLVNSTTFNSRWRGYPYDPSVIFSFDKINVNGKEAYAYEYPLRTYDADGNVVIYSSGYKYKDTGMITYSYPLEYNRLDAYFAQMIEKAADPMQSGYGIPVQQAISTNFNYDNITNTALYPSGWKGQMCEIRPDIPDGEKYNTILTLVLRDSIEYFFLKTLDVYAETGELVDIFKKAFVFPSWIDEYSLNPRKIENAQKLLEYMKDFFPNCAEWLKKKHNVTDEQVLLMLDSLADVKVAVTGENTDVFDSDIHWAEFIATPSGYHTEEQREAIKDWAESVFNGEADQWVYTAGNTHPTSNYQIESPLLSARLLGWQMGQYDIKNMLYWSALQSKYMDSIDADVIETVLGKVVSDNELIDIADFYTQGIHYGGVAGDGFLVYPGVYYGVTGPIGTVRTEAIRDSIEDNNLLVDLRSMYEVAGYEEAFENVMARLTELLYTGVRCKTQAGYVSAFQSARDSLASMLILARDYGVFVENVYIDGDACKYSILYPASLNAELGNGSEQAIKLNGLDGYRLIGNVDSTETFTFSYAGYTVNLSVKVLLETAEIKELVWADVSADTADYNYYNSYHTNGTSGGETTTVEVVDLATTNVGGRTTGNYYLVTPDQGAYTSNIGLTLLPSMDKAYYEEYADIAILEFDVYFENFTLDGEVLDTHKVYYTLGCEARNSQQNDREWFTVRVRLTDIIEKWDNIHDTSTADKQGAWSTEDRALFAINCNSFTEKYGTHITRYYIGNFRFSHI